MPSPEPALIFEDESLLGVGKPAGWHVFPGAAKPVLWEWLLAQRPGLAGVGPARQPAFVHRLDLGTSGVILAACTPRTYAPLRQSFKDGVVEKDYLVLAEGALESPKTIQLPLGARYRRSKRIQVGSAGKNLRWSREAHTEVWPLAKVREWTLCRVRIRTGIRHQIRAHMAAVGHPVAGDKAYGARTGADGYPFLHAWRLALPHPGTGEPWVCRCPLPEDRVAFLAHAGLAGGWAEMLP